MGDRTHEEFERQIVVPIMTGLQSNKMKSKAVWISCILAALFCARPANASVIMTLEQVGPNVVGTASGTVDLTDLTLFGVFATENGMSGINSFNGALDVGPGSDETVYSGISGPGRFGGGQTHLTPFGAGDELGIQGHRIPLAGPYIRVPVGYVSDTPLFGTSTWYNFSLTSLDSSSGLGVIPGIYTWTWGSGDHADSLTLFAGVPVSTSEPTTWSLLGISFAAIAGVAYWRRKSARVPDKAGDA